MKEQSQTDLQLMKGDHLQMIPIAHAKIWYDDFVAFSKSILKEGLDYGVIPGTPKPSLYKPGAEKLRFAYNLTTEIECIEKIVDLDRTFIDYTYRCTVKTKSGQVLAQCEGSCNSMEPKYGYLWKTITELPEGTDISRLQTKNSGKKISEFDFAINRGETTGQYGKPQEYWDKWVDAINNGTATKIQKATSKGQKLDAWQLDETVTLYRVPNPDVMGYKNTIMKMAQKRAMVGAIMVATGASEFFTQDVEDMEINGRIHSIEQPIEDAEVITHVSVAQREFDEEEAHTWHLWQQKLDECKTPQQVDDLAVKNQEAIKNSPTLRKAFTDRKAHLRRVNEVRPV